MRLIDADALEESLENSCKDTYETKMFVDFMSYIDEAPTIEQSEDCVKRIDAINGIANTHFAISYENYNELINVISNLPSALPQTNLEACITREFVEIIVHYPEVCPYKEYEGKPYFSIKYIENGQEFVGFGTYNPKVLSEYIRDFFTIKKGHWITVDDWYKCSECDDFNTDKDNYCPDCGAKMEVE